VRIKSPIEKYNGISEYGPVTLAFKDGVAEVEELSEGLRNYLEGRGYKVGRSKAAKETEDAGETSDFDPSGHTVAEVLAHLEAEGPEEVERVKAAEAAGQNRKSVAEYTAVTS
jgi:hypothetical protein